MKKIIIGALITIVLISLVYYGSEKKIKTFSDDSKGSDGYAITNEYKINVSYEGNVDEELHEKIKELFEQFPYDAINHFCSNNWSIKISQTIEKEVDIETKTLSIDNTGTNEDIFYRLKVALCKYTDYYYNNASSSSEFKKLYNLYCNKDQALNDYFIEKMIEYIENGEYLENKEPQLYKYFNGLEKKE